MLTQRIPAHQLYVLRNSIPINRLIQAMPFLAAKESQGALRFLCPLCSGFNTATNPKTNLARCFRCSRNFNTIDLVMQVQKINFKAAVVALSDYLQRISGASTRHLAPSPASPVASDSSRPLSSIRQILECALANSKATSP